MLIGYARVSTIDQNLNLQKDALQAAGCERLFTDTVSGARVERPGLRAALEVCRSDDTLVVWKLDRLGAHCRTWWKRCASCMIATLASRVCRSRLIPQPLAGN